MKGTVREPEQESFRKVKVRNPTNSCGQMRLTIQKQSKTHTSMYVHSNRYEHDESLTRRKTFL